MNKNIIAEFLYEFITTKYHINEEVDEVSIKDILSSIKTFDDANFAYNCHDVLEKCGIGIDQFKKDFSDLLLIFNRT